MKFSAVLVLALPTMVFGQMTTVTTTAAANSTATSTAPASTGTLTLEAICEAQAGPYANSCPRCLHTCATSTEQSLCYYSVFSAVNQEESVCEEQGGNNCAGRALDDVCGH